MTTLACDGKTVAADGQSICGNSIIDTNAEKIIVKEGRIFGVAGRYASLLPFARWILDGADPEAVPKIEHAVVIEFRDACAVLYQSDQPYPDEYEYPCAFGSGQPFALAAMSAGADAQKAVAVAARHDPDTGGTVRSIALGRIKDQLPVPISSVDGITGALSR